MNNDVLNAFYRDTFNLLEAIEDCFAKQRHLPCLILLFSTIDFMASLESGESTGATFAAWADEYLLKDDEIQCSGIELYASRCRVLHSFRAGSDLSRASKARRVFYAWGTGDSNDFNRSSKCPGGNQSVCAHVRRLIECLRNGLAEYMEDVKSDKVRTKNFLAGVGMWVVDLTQNGRKSVVVMRAKAEAGKG